MEELVAVIELKEQAKADSVTKTEAMTKIEEVIGVNPFEAGPKTIEIEREIRHIRKQSADEQFRVEVITTTSVEPEPATKEVVVGTKP